MHDNVPMSEPRLEVIDGLLQEITNRRASDLLLTTGAPPLLRIDGALVPLDAPPLDADDTERIVLSILGPEVTARFVAELMQHGMHILSDEQVPVSYTHLTLPTILRV